jgi:pilus assembly protein Flp/PilA
MISLRFPYELHEEIRPGERRMLVLKALNALRTLLNRDEGQDLVEYALVVAIIAFGAVTAMKGLSAEINVAFKTISSNLSTSL